jgi:hypothetical protein
LGAPLTQATRLFNGEFLSKGISFFVFLKSVFFGLIQINQQTLFAIQTGPAAFTTVMVMGQIKLHELSAQAYSPYPLGAFDD